MRIAVVIIVVLLAVGAGVVIVSTGLLDGPGPMLIRGPYLQSVLADRATVCCDVEPVAPVTLEVRNHAGTIVFTADSAEASHHEIQVAGLMSGTKYAYRLEVAGPAEPVRGTLTTAPAPGQPIVFSFWGDSRSHPDRCAAVARQILAFDAPMTLHSGDFVTNGAHGHEWTPMFFEPTRELMRSVCLWPAIGNHELGTTVTGKTGRDFYREVFALPGNEQYYSFDYGNAHFLVLDSNMDFFDDDDQYAFAEGDLTGCDAPWKIVMLHHPFFNAGHHPSHVMMRARYAPLFARTNVDLIITGHDHNYQRARPIRHHYEPAQQHPYLHIVSGGGGAPSYDLPDELPDQKCPWIETYRTVPHAVKVRIEGDRLEGQAVDADGNTFDSFVIDRSVPTTDSLPYERIELRTIYRSLPLVDDQHNPLPGLLLEPHEQQTVLTYVLPNPLPEPIQATLTPPRGSGIEMALLASRIELPPDRGQSLTLSCQILDPAGLRTMTGMRAQLDTPVGAVTVDMLPPPIALRRSLTAAPVAEGSITIDGLPGDDGWQRAEETFGFVRSFEHRLLRRNGELVSRVRAVHDDANLYLLVTRVRPLGKGLRRHSDPRQSDHMQVFLADGSQSLRLWVDATNQTHLEAERTTEPDAANSSPRLPANLGVRTAVERHDNDVVTEVAIPRAFFAPAGDAPDARLYFNVSDDNGRYRFRWSPTFGETTTRSNSGYLVLP